MQLPKQYKFSLTVIENHKSDPSYWTDVNLEPEEKRHGFIRETLINMFEEYRFVESRGDFILEMVPEQAPEPASGEKCPHCGHDTFTSDLGYCDGCGYGTTEFEMEMISNELDNIEQETLAADDYLDLKKPMLRLCKLLREEFITK